MYIYIYIVLEPSVHNVTCGSATAYTTLFAVREIFGPNKSAEISLLAQSGGRPQKQLSSQYLHFSSLSLYVVLLT